MEIRGRREGTGRRGRKSGLGKRREWGGGERGRGGREGGWEEGEKIANVNCLRFLVGFSICFSFLPNTSVLPYRNKSRKVCR